MVDYPDIHNTAAFEAALQPHIDRLKLCRMFMDMDAKWESKEALELFYLMREMARFMDLEANPHVIRLRNEIRQLGGDSEAMYITEGGGWTGITQGIIDILNKGSAPGHYALFKGAAIEPLLTILTGLRNCCFESYPAVVEELELEIELYKIDGSFGA